MVAEGGLLIALGVAFAIIVLAILLTRLFGQSGRRYDDVNGSPSDGRANATWIGIRAARDEDGDFGDRDG